MFIYTLEDIYLQGKGGQERRGIDTYGLCCYSYKMLGFPVSVNESIETTASLSSLIHQRQNWKMVAKQH